MSRIPIYEKGDIARFEVSFEDASGNVLEPDVLNGERDVSLLVKKVSTDETVLEDTQMQELSSTQFRFDFQTTQGTKPGEYSVEISAAFSNDTNVNRERFKVVDILDPNVGQ